MAMSCQMGIQTATAYAEKIVAVLAPFCDRIEVAGSIRRRCQEVHNVNLVAIARDRMGMEKRMLERAQGLEWGGAMFKVLANIGVLVEVYYAHAGIPDLYQARPSNWGSVLLGRTGSRAHNVRFTQQAAGLGLTWQLRNGLVDATGQVVASCTEQDLYQAIGLPFLAPEQRG